MAVEISFEMMYGEQEIGVIQKLKDEGTLDEKMVISRKEVEQFIRDEFGSEEVENVRVRLELDGVVY